LDVCARGENNSTVASWESERSEKEVVALTRHGQATIPKRFREKREQDREERDARVSTEE
jgi:hypothetical protein